ncbi:hypothetical protein BDZ91DRAFT_71158 [Kalaharituber pfeilii]|nr:hypothetical protein BDZ91DRAFT_71158 [Kalaharituber pfeilii]
MQGVGSVLCLAGCAALQDAGCGDGQCFAKRALEREWRLACHGPSHGKRKTFELDCFAGLIGISAIACSRFVTPVCCFWSFWVLVFPEACRNSSFGIVVIRPCKVCYGLTLLLRRSLYGVVTSCAIILSL